MTEEVDRRHGVNGNSSGNNINEDVPVQNSGSNVSTGGRLKFFKDGKFILELVRGCAREGERAGWVSVPRKTFWPPAAAPATPPASHAHARFERAASLSVSDDNSSIQSSPWQRDHCWKQNNPRKNISKELAMYYCRPSTLLNVIIGAGSRLKRRRPYDAAAVDAPGPPLTNGLGADHRILDTVDGAHSASSDDSNRWTEFDKDKYYHIKLKKPYQYFKLRVYKKTKPSSNRGKLSTAIDRLREKVAALPAPINAKLASCRQEHMMVSPRKRILRELERVTLEDQGGKRRARSTPAPVPASTGTAVPSPGPSRPIERPHNGTAATARRDPPTKNVSSYSIHSLLSIPDEPAAASAPAITATDVKRSPHAYGGTLKTESPSGVHSPDLSPSPDSYRYRYGPLALGSPAGSTTPRDSPTPPSELSARYRTLYAPSPTSSYGPPPPARSAGARTSPLCYGPPVTAAASSHPYRAAATATSPRDEWRDMGYAYGAYGPYLSAMYRAPAAGSHNPLWMQYAIPPGPWAQLPHPLLTDRVLKDDTGSDLPLNLSKH
ncbi:Protein hairless [Eumeta japonica]|uniref:Protein hairless n=1 Tax=Eumeta variegata TaxID=151549 RepID=A0A4C1ZR01_EUMVA|nr:Protein hairless [Eumeta japonica]